MGKSETHKLKPESKHFLMTEIYGTIGSEGVAFFVLLFFAIGVNADHFIMYKLMVSR